ncbi:MAG: glycosyltransferase family 4 protein [Acidobacteriota bacterium]
MKILFVNQKCGYFGGVEQNVADTAEGLRLRGHQCFLVYGERTNRNTFEYQQLFTETFYCKELMQNASQSNGERTRNQAPLSFKEILQSISPDVVYFHKVPDMGEFVDSLHNVKTVRMIHDHDLCCPRRHKYFAKSEKVCTQPVSWRCFLDGAFLERAPKSLLGVKFVNINKKINEMRRNYQFDTLLVGSRFMRDELLMNGFPSDRVFTLPPVVKAPVEKPMPVPKEKQILYVGQLIRGKGVDLMLKALKKIRCDFTASLVGTGNAVVELEKLSRELGLGNRVKFRGWVNNSQLNMFYDAAKVVVVPSRWPEPFGMIGLEAMRHGRPVVGFAVGGIPDWLEQNSTGVLVPEQDTDAMATAIERILINDELATKYGYNAYQRYRSVYGFEDYLIQLESCLQVGKEALCPVI